MSKDDFLGSLRAVNVDEAHCISLWGGSFRPDYSALGDLRARFPRNISFLAASATIPDHILDDVRHKLQLEKDAKMIQLTNARPNVALSVRVIKHTEESKADLRFLIPPKADKPEDIAVTLVYCNSRTDAEDGCDRLRDWAEEQGIPRECIGFYHAVVGENQKRLTEKNLEEGNIRILFCTDAVGMVRTSFIHHNK